MTIRLACFRLHDAFHADPNFVAYGEDVTGTRVCLYASGPIAGVPANYEGWPVSVVPIESVRFAAGGEVSASRPRLRLTRMAPSPAGLPGSARISIPRAGDAPMPETPI